MKFSPKSDRRGGNVTRFKLPNQVPFENKRTVNEQ
jgi:hypothetical protein